MYSADMYTIFLVFLAPLTPVLAHMQMAHPYPINSQQNPDVPDNLKDYSYTSPLAASGANFPCKGYQNVRPILITATYTAGQSYDLVLTGSATHGGGSCQISLSYDNGKTFRVIKSMIGGCPLTTTYDFTIPSYAPSGTALLAWSWWNLVGNREFYQNAAWVTISSTTKPSKKRSSKHRRDAGVFASFEDLPYIWKANLPDQNTCVTMEGVAPVFPEPGPDVIYGGGLSSSSPVTPGKCNDAGPPGAAYSALAIGNVKAGQGSDMTSDIASTSAVPSYQTTSTVSPMTMSSTRQVISTTSVANSEQSRLTTSSTMFTVSLIYPNASTSSSYSLPRTVITSSSTFTSSQFYLNASSSAYSLPRVLTTPVTSSVSSSSTLTLATATPSSVYSSSITFLVVSTPPALMSTSIATRTTAVPVSTATALRSACDGAAMGTFKCVRGGQGFAVCNWGNWDDMGAVAAGTQCQGLWTLTCTQNGVEEREESICIFGRSTDIQCWVVSTVRRVCPV